MGSGSGGTSPPSAEKVNINKLEDRSTWGVEDWAWDSQDFKAVPKIKSSKSPACSAPSKIEKAMPTLKDNPASGSEDGGGAPSATQTAGASGASGSGRSSKGQFTSRPGVCQADGCGKSLSKLTFYHVRNKICDLHIKCDVFLRDGVELRFCQRCGHPHPLSEFDGTKHSCRAQLEKHNARRRKRQAEAAQKKSEDSGGAKKPGRRQAATTSSAEEEKAEAAKPVRRSNRRRSTLFDLAVDAAGEEDLELDEAPAAPRHAGTSSSLPQTTSQGAGPSADAPVAVETSPAPAAAEPPAAHASSPFSPSPLLQHAATDGGLGSNPQPDDTLADDLSAWLTSHLAEIETGGNRDGEIDLAKQADELLLGGISAPFALPNAAEGTSIDFAANLMQSPALTSSQAGGSGLNLPTGPQLTQEAMLSTVSVKLFGCTPGQLPNNLREQLTSWFNGNVTSLDGYLRPGCVHLTVQATVTPTDEAGGSNAALTGKKREAPEGAGRDVQGSLGAEGVVRLVEKMLASGEPLWRSKTMLVQSGREVALVHQGKMQHAWDIGAAQSERAVPAVLEMKPMVLLASSAAQAAKPCCGGGNAPAKLVSQGVNLLQDDCEIVCRLQGQYVNVKEAKCGECKCLAAVQECCRGSGANAAASASKEGWESRCCGCCVSKLVNLSLEEQQESAAEAAVKPCCAGKSASVPSKVDDAPLQLVSLNLEGTLRPGLLHVDVLKRAYMSPRGGRVLVVDSVAVHDELLAFAARAPSAAAASWVDALGVVLEWVGDHNKMNFTVVERLATKLIHQAIASGLVQVAKYLHDLLQKELMTAAASVHLPRSVSALDGLALMSHADQACRSAALLRISKLGTAHGLSLLHCAVQSQDPTVLEMVMSWGREAELPWRNDVKGPYDLTPLHLAVLVQDPTASARMILALITNCAPGQEAWTAALTTDDMSPADFAERVQRGGLLQAFGTRKSAVIAEKEQKGLLNLEDAGVEVAPSTPRRCKCHGPCPCAVSAEPCAGCMSFSSDDEACCGGDTGTCSCCAKMEIDSNDGDQGNAPKGCCGGGGAATNPTVVRSCCH